MRTAHFQVLLFISGMVLLSCSDESESQNSNGKWEVLPGTNGAIFCLVAAEQGVFFAGNFTAGEAASMKYVGYLDTENMSYKSPFRNITSVGNSGTRGIFSLLVYDDYLLFGGNIEAINDMPFTHIGKYSLATKTVEPLGNNVPINVTPSDLIPIKSLALSNSGVLVGGMFPKECSYLTSYNMSTEEWSCSTLDATGMYYGGVNTILVVDNYAYLGGGRLPGGSLIRYNLTTNSYENLIDTYTFIKSMVIVGDYLYVGGCFDAIGGIIANGIARYNLNTKEWSSLDVQSSEYLFCIEKIISSDNKLYVAGNFELSSIGAQGVASYDLETKTWKTLGEGVEGPVYDLLIKGEHLYAGGTFISAGGKAATGFARYKF